MKASNQSNGDSLESVDVLSGESATKGLVFTFLANEGVDSTADAPVKTLVTV